MTNNVITFEELSPAQVALLRRIGDEITRAFSPLTTEYNTVSIGSDGNYNAAVAQARSDMKQAICKRVFVDDALTAAKLSLLTQVAKLNERFKKSYTLQRWSEHGQDKLISDAWFYKQAGFK